MRKFLMENDGIWTPKMPTKSTFAGVLDAKRGLERIAFAV
jgi:hypothetical protein